MIRRNNYAALNRSQMHHWEIKCMHNECIKKTADNRLIRHPDVANNRGDGGIMKKLNPDVKQHK